MFPNAPRWNYAALLLLMPAAVLLLVTAVASWKFAPPYEKHQYIDFDGNRVGEIFSISRSLLGEPIQDPESQTRRTRFDASFALLLLAAGMGAHFAARGIAARYPDSGSIGALEKAGPGVLMGLLSVVSFCNAFAIWEAIQLAILVFRGSDPLIQWAYGIGTALAFLGIGAGVLLAGKQETPPQVIPDAMLVPLKDVAPEWIEVFRGAAEADVCCAVTLRPEIHLFMGRVSVDGVSHSGLLAVLPLPLMRVSTPDELVSDLRAASAPFSRFSEESSRHLWGLQQRFGGLQDRLAHAISMFGPFSRMGAWAVLGMSMHLDAVLGEIAVRRQLSVDLTRQMPEDLSSTGKAFVLQVLWPRFWREATAQFRPGEPAQAKLRNLSLEFAEKIRAGELRPNEEDPESFSQFLDLQMERGWNEGIRDFDKLDFAPQPSAHGLLQNGEALEIELSRRERQKFVLD